MEDNKVVIVTGASSGIGRACAIEFAKNGYSVVLSARNLDTLKKAEEKCNNEGGSHLIVKADVSIESDCKNIVDKCIEHFGRLDILINNAGVSMRAAFSDLDIDVFKTLMDVNFWGTVFCTKYSLPHIIETKGTIVGISTIAGFVGLPGRTGYSASKFAVNGFLKALRTENFKKGINILITSPWFVSSNIRNNALTKDGSVQQLSPKDEKKLMSTEKVARLIFKAVKRRQRYQFITWKGKLLILLNKIFPIMIDRIIYKQLSKEPASPFK